MNDYLTSLIEVPFEYRHTCWFCGEPSAHDFTFPHAHHIVIACPHPELTLPSCQECRILAIKIKAITVWELRSELKKQLINTYREHLAIGINWTKEELANSEFDGGNFEGFKRSGWFMYEVAKARVNFIGWPIVHSGLVIETSYEKESFSFDGVVYPHIDDAIMHYTRTYYLPTGYLEQVVHCLGIQHFAKSVSFCRLMVGSTPNERKLALRELIFTDDVLKRY